MDAGELPLFNHIAPPPIAIAYWKLGASISPPCDGPSEWNRSKKATNSLEPDMHYTTHCQKAPDASFRDLLLAIRMDEATHREVNHTFANLKEDDYNPYVANEEYHARVTEQDKK